MALTGFLIILIANIQAISQRNSILELVELGWPADVQFSAYSPILANLLNGWDALIMLGIILIGLVLIGTLTASASGVDSTDSLSSRYSGNFRKPTSLLIVGLTVICLSLSGKSAASFTANQIWSSILKVSSGSKADPLISQRLVEMQKPWNLPIWFGTALLASGAIYYICILGSIKSVLNRGGGDH